MRSVTYAVGGTVNGISGQPAFVVAPLVAVASLLAAFSLLDVRPLVVAVSAATVAVSSVVLVAVVRRARDELRRTRVVIVRDPAPRP